MAFISNVENVFKKPLTNEERLLMFGFFKQATEGNVKGSQPWKVQLEKRAKWDRWNAIKGMARNDAGKKYVEALEGFKKSNM